MIVFKMTVTALNYISKLENFAWFTNFQIVWCVLLSWVMYHQFRIFEKEAMNLFHSYIS